MSESRHPVHDVDLHPWSRVRLWLFCGGVLAVLYGLSRDPSWVERTYVDGWGVAVARALGQATGVVPVAVGEWLIGLAVVAHVLLVLTALSEAGAGRRRWRNVALSGLMHTVDLALVLVTLFYLVWGVSYARAPALERLGWTDRVEAAEVGPEALAELEALAWSAHAEARQAYLGVHGSLDPGVVTTPREGLDVDAALEAGFAAAARDLGLPDSFAARRAPAKVPMASELMSWFGIGGIYLPFTGEANVNGGPPAWTRVFTAAHEKAHQRMVASEDEASFFGFLALAYSDEPLLRYAGWEFARRQLVRALRKADRERAAPLDAAIWPGLALDLKTWRDHWKAYEGPLEDVGRTVNDTYLKANRVEGGVLAYGRAGRLVAAFLTTEQGRRRLRSMPPLQAGQGEGAYEAGASGDEGSNSSQAE